MVGERSSEGRGVREERRGRDREQVREYTLNGSTIILMIIIRFSRQTHPAINHEIASIKGSGYKFLSLLPTNLYETKVGQHPFEAR